MRGCSGCCSRPAFVSPFGDVNYRHAGPSVIISRPPFITDPYQILLSQLLHLQARLHILLRTSFTPFSFEFSLTTKTSKAAPLVEQYIPCTISHACQFRLRLNSLLKWPSSLDDTQVTRFFWRYSQLMILRSDHSLVTALYRMRSPLDAELDRFHRLRTRVSQVLSSAA